MGQKELLLLFAPVHDGLNGLDDIVHVGWETAGLQFGEDDLSIDGDLEGTGSWLMLVPGHLGATDGSLNCTLCRHEAAVVASGVAVLDVNLDHD